MFKFKGIQVSIQVQGDMGRALELKILEKGNILQVGPHKLREVQAESIFQLLDIFAVDFPFQLNRRIAIPPVQVLQPYLPISIGDIAIQVHHRHQPIWIFHREVFQLYFPPLLFGFWLGWVALRPVFQNQLTGNKIQPLFQSHQGIFRVIRQDMDQIAGSYFVGR